METAVSVKTTTTVTKSSGAVNIHCFSDMNVDGSTHPSIFKSQVLSEVKIIDNTYGKEGELMISYDKNSNAIINPLGALVISPDGDNVNYYERGSDDNIDLIYSED